MPAVAVPESGWTMEGPGEDSLKSSAVHNAIGLTLTNGIIEDMIKCVQDGKPIQLSLGPQPVSSFLPIVVVFWGLDARVGPDCWYYRDDN